MNHVSKINDLKILFYERSLEALDIPIKFVRVAFRRKEARNNKDLQCLTELWEVQAQIKLIRGNSLFRLFFENYVF